MVYRLQSTRIMFQIDLRIRASNRAPSMVVRSGMADWMDSFLANEKSLDSAKETDALLMGFAIACTPVMTKRLVDQLEKDVRKYAAAKSDPIRISPYGHGAHIIR